MLYLLQTFLLETFKVEVHLIHSLRYKKYAPWYYSLENIALYENKVPGMKPMALSVPWVESLDIIAL